MHNRRHNRRLVAASLVVVRHPRLLSLPVFCCSCLRSHISTTTITTSSIASIVASAVIASTVASAIITTISSTPSAPLRSPPSSSPPSPPAAPPSPPPPSLHRLQLSRRRQTVFSLPPASLLVAAGHLADASLLARQPSRRRQPSRCASLRLPATLPSRHRRPSLRRVAAATVVAATSVSPPPVFWPSPAFGLSASHPSRQPPRHGPSHDSWQRAGVRVIRLYESMTAPQYSLGQLFALYESMRAREKTSRTGFLIFLMP